MGDEEAELEAARWLLFETMIQSGPLWEMKICARLPAGDECVFGVWKAAAALLGEPFDEADPKRSASGLMRDFKGFLDRLQDLPAAAQRWKWSIVACSRWPAFSGAGDSGARRRTTWALSGASARYWWAISPSPRLR